MNLLEAAKPALEALDYIYATSDDQQEKKTDAISALRAAIKEAEKQEPVGVVKWQVGGNIVHLVGDVETGDVLYTHPAPAVPEGWQLVPKEPTFEMIHAGTPSTEGHYSLPVSLYKAMLAAAPKFGEKE